MSHTKAPKRTFKETLCKLTDKARKRRLVRAERYEALVKKDLYEDVTAECHLVRVIREFLEEAANSECDEVTIKFGYHKCRLWVERSVADRVYIDGISENMFESLITDDFAIDILSNILASDDILGMPFEWNEDGDATCMKFTWS